MRKHVDVADPALCEQMNSLTAMCLKAQYFWNTAIRTLARSATNLLFDLLPHPPLSLQNWAVESTAA